MISAYSLSFPLLSLHLRNMTEASTLAGEKVLGSLSREITLSRIVLVMTQQHIKPQTDRKEKEDTSISDRVERKALHKLFETLVSSIPAETEALPHLFLPFNSITVQATPSMLRFSNTDSALSLFSWRKRILLT